MIRSFLSSISRAFLQQAVSEAYQAEARISPAVPLNKRKTIIDKV